MFSVKERIRSTCNGSSSATFWRWIEASFNLRCLQTLFSVNVWENTFSLWCCSVSVYSLTRSSDMYITIVPASTSRARAGALCLQPSPPKSPPLQVGLSLSAWSSTNDSRSSWRTIWPACWRWGPRHWDVDTSFVCMTFRPSQKLMHFTNIPLLFALSLVFPPGWRGPNGWVCVEVLHPAVGGLPFL